MLITEQILKEAEEFSEDLTSAIFDTMDDYQACDFEDEEDYAESIIDYTLGRLGYDIMDDDNSEEYDELYEIALRNFGPTLMIFYQQICSGDEKENPLD